MRNEKEYPYVAVIDGVEVVYFNSDFIVGRWAKARWNNRTKKYYLTLGYEYTGHLKEFIVDVHHLTIRSEITVDAFCPLCKKFRILQFCSLNKVCHSKCHSCTKIVNEIGNRYGRLSVINFEYINKYHHTCWRCLCDCGNITIVKGVSLRVGDTKSCGCLQKESATARLIKYNANTPRPKGSDHPNWNSNLTDEDRANKRISQYIKFSLPVFERDNFICQISGQKGSGNLEAHHLEDNSTNPEIAFDLSNGITTINERHREFHKWNGGTHTSCTKQDMIDFCELFYPNAPFLKSL